MSKLIEYINKIKKNIKVKREGGVLYSQTLRDFTEKKYGVSVGLYSYGSCFDKGFNLMGKVKIGRYCSIASNVHYLAGNHPVDHLTSSAIFYNKKLSNLEVEDIQRHSLTVGNDVWIGYGVLITASCSVIGNGAVIGAGSVVTHDVEPYTIVAGNPARVIRKRFDDDIIEKIEKSKWWNRNPQELIEYYRFMSDPESFCTQITQRSE